MLRGLSKLRGQFFQQRGNAAHLAHLADLLLEIIQIKAFARLELLRQGLGFFLVDAALGVFNQTENVAHAEDARGHALRVKLLDTGKLFAHPGKLDRLAGDMTHRQGRPAPGITVELGQHHTRQRQRFIEGFGCIHGILAQHGINHKQRFDGLELGVQLLDLVHHGRINRQAARRIDEKHIVIMLLRIIQRGGGDIGGLLADSGREEINAGLARHGFQLLDGGRTIHVTGHRQHFFLLPLAQPFAQLGRGRGFTRPLQACHENDGGRLRGQIQFGIRAAHQIGQLAMHHANQRLPRTE